jgi:hypothetical protein
VVSTATGPDTLTGFTFETYIVAPSISTVYPWSGQPGDTVQIYGSGFTGTTSVTFGGVSTTFVIRGDGLLVATIGNGASGNIVVTNSAGTAQTGPWRFIPPTPIITSFSPQSGPAGTLITIRGANLSSTWAAFVGQSLGEYGLLNLTVVSDSVVTGNVNSLSNSGPVTVWATGGDVSFGEFTVLPAGTPQISGISPVSGVAGTVDTITGLNFTGITAVSFGGTAATSFTIVSPTMITAVVGQGATGSVEVSGQRTGVNFYRLAIIDVAFDSIFSKTIAVQLAGVPWTLTVYPNPVSGGYFTVSVPSILTPSYFQLADMSGNVIQRIQVSAGTLQQKIMTTGLQNGVYKIVWSDGNNSSFQTVLILK